MILFGIYLLKVSLCLSLFLLLYGVALRHTTFFQLNRYYLVIGIVVSFIIPGITISWFAQPYDFSLTESIETSWIETIYTSPATKPVDVVDHTINYTFLLSMVYFIGALILLSRSVLFIIRLIRIINTSEMTYFNNVRIVKTKQSQAFTFFHVILLPEHEIDQAILTHEKVHVTQRHWIDLLLIELTCVMLWFNPLIVLYRKAIQQQHEYLADSHTLESGIAIEQYLHCLLNHIQLENTFVLVNKFYSKPIKDRIMMMTKNKTSMKFKSMYLLLIPALCLLLVAFSNKPVAFEPDMVADETITIEGNFVTDDTQPSIAPIQMEKAKISATYGERIHPATGKKQFHTGIDFRLAEGEVVMTTAKGVIVESRYDSLRGNYIIVKHDDIYTTSYSHMKSNLVKAGDPVEVGQKIGYVGSSGKLSTGPHLHYEVIKNGKPVDPKGYLPE
jgi:beta-lactamase regulating signal transducer with metallopeptidase domain